MGILSSLSLPSLYPGIDEERSNNDKPCVQCLQLTICTLIFRVFFFQSCLKLKAYHSGARYKTHTTDITLLQ